MFPYSIRWDKIKEKEGDDITIVLSPVQRSLLIGIMLNIQAIGEASPDSMYIGNDSDNFDAVVSDIQSKLASAE